MLKFALVGCCAVIVASSSALGQSARRDAGLAFPASYYQTFANGVPAARTFFPISIWLQAPQRTTGVGANVNVAAAAKAEGINVFLGFWGNGPTSVSGSSWPERYGSDDGELEAAAAQGIYVIAGGDPAGNASAYSVASVLALASAQSATRYLIGYNYNDEPTCGSNAKQAGHVPTEVAAIRSYDPTRVQVYNMASWVPAFYINDAGARCGGSVAQMTAAFAAPDVGSYDAYPYINPYFAGVYYNCSAGAHVAPSDFVSRPVDCIWMNGLAVQVERLLNPNKPNWAFVDTGGDALSAGGLSEFLADLNAGSNVISHPQGVGGGGVAPRFTIAWLGLGLSGPGIPANTKLIRIVDASHAVMSASATASATSGSIKITGGAQAYPTYGRGPGYDCIIARNLCVVSGNRYKSTPAEVFAEVWNDLISGANGINYFGHDSCSETYWAGDADCPGSAVVAANLTYIDRVIATYAVQLNTAPDGICTMQKTDGTTATSCADGILKMSTASAAVPGLARVSHVNGVHYLMVQTDRNSASGAPMTYTLRGLARKHATVVYDSASRYDRRHDTTGATFALSSLASFTDTLGANADHYQVKIYAIR